MVHADCTRVCYNIYFCDLQRRDSNDDERDGSTKKPRVVWSVEMHQQFVNAVNQLGIDSKPSFHLMYRICFTLCTGSSPYCLVQLGAREQCREMLAGQPQLCALLAIVYGSRSEIPIKTSQPAKAGS